MVGLFLNDEKCLLPVCYIWNEQFPIILFLIWVHRGSKTWQEILRRIIKFNKSWVRYSINQSRILAVAAVRLKEGDGELGQDCEELKMSDATYSNLKKKKKNGLRATSGFPAMRHALIFLLLLVQYWALLCKPCSDVCLKGGHGQCLGRYKTTQSVTKTC